MTGCPDDGTDEPMWCHKCRRVCMSANCPCNHSHDGIEEVIEGLETALKVLSKQIIKGEFVP